MITGFIAWREFKSLFLSPLGWSILGVVQLIIAYQFLEQLEQYMLIQAELAMQEQAIGVTQIIIAPLLGSTAIILLLIIPLLTMRLISEERRNQTLPLLFSAPLSMTEIILGKYLGILTFIFLMVGIIALMPFSLLLGTDIDLGQTAAALLGLTLLLASFAAAGLYMSTLTRQPAVAAINTFGLLLFLWIINWAGESNTSLLAYLSLLSHFEALLKGLFNSTDICFFLLFILLFITLSIRRLEHDRLPH